MPPFPEDDDGYELVLGRNTELEVDLAAATSALERAQADNFALRDVHTDLTNAYKRLQEQHERLRLHARRDQEQRHQQEDEHQRQIATWRSQLEAKDREFEEVSKRSRPQGRELDALRLQIAEEVEEPYVQRVRGLEGQLAAEQRKCTDAQRRTEVLKLDGETLATNLREELAELDRRHKLRERALERQIAGLETDVQKHAEAAQVAPQLRTQVHDLEVKLAGLQRTVQEQEQQCERERAATAEDLKKRGEELSAARRRAHDLQVQHAHAEQCIEKAVAEGEVHRREVGRLAGQLETHKAAEPLAAGPNHEEHQRLRDEHAKLKVSHASERDHLSRAHQATEEQHQAAILALRKSEARLRQLEEEHAEHVRDLQSEREETERQFRADRAALSGKHEAAEKELDSKKLTWRAREAALVCQIEAATARHETIHDELAQSQSKHEHVERRLREAQREHQQHHEAWQSREASLHSERREHEALHKDHVARTETELAAHRERLEHHIRESGEHIAAHSTAADTARALLAKLEPRYDAVRAELALTSAKLDEERARFARELDEASAAALFAEEQRRAAALKVAVEDHKRQMNRLQTGAKKALKKAALKRQEQRQKYQDLAKRVAQLQQEKLTAIRICEENKNTFELRLAELSVAARLGAPAMPLSQSVQYVPQTNPLVGSVSGSVASRSELRSIAERLDRNAEWMRLRNIAAESNLSPRLAPSRGAAV